MSPSRYMLDTNIASYIVRGPVPALAAKLREAPPALLSVSAVTQGELQYGVARRPAASNLKIAVEAFLARVTVLPWDAAVADRYGALRAELEARGTPLANLDTMIAAHALAVDAILVSNDQTFAQVPNLVLENWTV